MKINLIFRFVSWRRGERRACSAIYLLRAEMRGERQMRLVSCLLIFLFFKITQSDEKSRPGEEVSPLSFPLPQSWWAGNTKKTQEKSTRFSRVSPYFRINQTRNGCWIPSEREDFYPKRSRSGLSCMQNPRGLFRDPPTLPLGI